MKIHLSMTPKRIVLRTDRWAEGLAEACKAIAGASWSKVRREWSYPLSMHTLREMREVFGQQLVVSPDLWAWAKKERARERRLKALATKHDAGLKVVPKVAPMLAQAMTSRTYQRSAARFGANAGSFLLADEPGLGKTATALAALMEMGLWYGEHLVVAPKSSLQTVWARQIALWTGAPVVAMPDSTRAKREAALKHYNELANHPANPGPTFLVVHPAMLRRRYNHYCAQCKVWDVKNQDPFPIEHYLEGHKTKRAAEVDDWPEIVDGPWTSCILDESHQALASYLPSNVSMTTQGLLDISKNVKHRIALTGTPLRGAEQRIWGTLDWLGHETGGYWAFINSFFDVANNGYSPVILGLRQETAESFYKTLDRFVLRRTRAEVRPDLPIGKREPVLVDMSPRHAKQYEEFERLGEAALESGTVAGQGVLSELTRLKQMAFGFWKQGAGSRLIPTGESPELEWLYQFLLDRGVSGKKTESWLPEPGVAYKYVVASQFTEIIDVLESELNRTGIPTLKVTGAVTGARRDDAVNKFQSDDTEYRVMLIQTQTGGVSIELDAWCDDMIILDETYVADDQVQLEGRINNRSGRVSPRTWWYVRVAGTVHEKLADDNNRQHNLQHQLLDGRRGVNTALHLLKGKPWTSLSSQSSEASASTRSASSPAGASRATTRSTTRRSTSPSARSTPKSNAPSQSQRSKPLPASTSTRSTSDLETGNSESRKKVRRK